MPTEQQLTEAAERWRAGYGADDSRWGEMCIDRNLLADAAAAERDQTPLTVEFAESLLGPRVYDGTLFARWYEESARWEVTIRTASQDGPHEVVNFNTGFRGRPATRGEFLTDLRRAGIEPKGADDGR